MTKSVAFKRRQSKTSNKKERRSSRQHGSFSESTNTALGIKFDQNFHIKNVIPKTKIQEEILGSWANTSNHILLHGYAGVGKSYISLFLALKEVLEKQNYEKIIIIRSTSQIRDMGFLPGKADEKIAEFEAPYKDIVNDLFSRGDAYSILKAKGVLEFHSTSFIRGKTFNNAIMILEEIQNYTEAECVGIFTRVGKNSRVLVNGDDRQIDLSGKKNDISWIHNILKIIYDMDSFDVFEFQFEDIVRSKFVKEFMMSYERLFSNP